MARALQAGEQVSVKKGFRPQPNSPAYQQGLKAVGPKLVGEVVGPAPEGRAVMVRFNGVEVAVTTHNLVRTEEGNQQRNDNTQEGTQQAVQMSSTPDTGGLITEQATQVSEPKKTRGRRSKTEQPAADTQQPHASEKRGRPPKSAQSAQQLGSTDLGESELQLLTLIANNLLLKGHIKVDSDAAVEISLRDLPSTLRRHLQRLIDAKLSLDLKGLEKR